jgi:hypothetical protein
MSRQPSTVENLRDTASEATYTVAVTLYPSDEKKADKWGQDEALKDAQRPPL